MLLIQIVNASLFLIPSTSYVFKSMPDNAAYYLLIAPTAMDASSTQVCITQQKFRLISVTSLLSKPDISYVIESMSKTTRLIDRANSHAAASHLMALGRH